MFSALMQQLRDELDKAELISQLNENIRNLLLGIDENVIGSGERTGPSPQCIDSLKAVVGTLPSKVDWQIYDHYASVGRLYAAFERYVNELVRAYVGMLPSLYRTLGDLPETIATNHRIGIGQILQKIGTRKSYRNIDETTAIRALSSGQSDGSGYTLIPEAFLVEKLNYRMDVIGPIFSSLDIEQCAFRVEAHPMVRELIENTIGQSTTAASELERFIRYRNDAAHDVPEEILSHDEVMKLRGLIIAIGTALADIVRKKVLQRHVDIGNTRSIGKVTESHYKGSVIVLVLEAEERLAIKDLLCISDERSVRIGEILSIQENSSDVEYVEGKLGQEIGLKLSIKCLKGADVRVLSLPSREDPAAPIVPVEISEQTVELPPSFESVKIGRAHV